MSKKESSEEIDLGSLFKGIKDSFNRFQGRIFDFLMVLVNYKVVIFSLLVIGAIAGYFLDAKKVQLKRTEIVVIPNFDSSDFLYRNIENINSLFSKKRKDELEDIFGEYFEGVISLDIEPIYDLRLIMRSTELMDILKESVKDNRLSWIQEEFKKGRIQKYHSIELITEEDTDALAVAHRLIEYLNSNDFYKQIRKISLENVKFQLEEFDRTLIQIDSVIATTTSKKINPSPTSQGFFLNDNSHISSLIEYKSVILEEKFEKLRRYEQKDDVIHLVSIDTSTEVKRSKLFSNLKISLPVFLVIAFILGLLTINYLRHISKYSTLYSNKKED